MHAMVNRQELLDAMQVIFGPAVDNGVNYLHQVSESDFKSVFRKRVMNSHPDRAVHVGRSPEVLTREVQQINQAYQVLFPFIHGRKTGAEHARGRAHTARPASPRTRAYSRTRTPKTFFHSGGMPPRRLRLAQFLFYCKVIDWQTMIDALIWQMRRRPKFGIIAAEWDLLTTEEIIAIIRSAKMREKFGETAVRLKLMSEFDVLSVLGKQRGYDCCIGRFFVDTGRLTRYQLDDYLRQQMRHNRLYPVRG